MYGSIEQQNPVNLRFRNFVSVLFVVSIVANICIFMASFTRGLIEQTAECSTNYTILMSIFMILLYLIVAYELVKFKFKPEYDWIIEYNGHYIIRSIWVDCVIKFLLLISLGFFIVTPVLNFHKIDTFDDKCDESIKQLTFVATYLPVSLFVLVLVFLTPFIKYEKNIYCDCSCLSDSPLWVLLAFSA